MKVAIIQLGYADGSGESVEERAERAAGLVARAGAGHDLVLESLRDPFAARRRARQIAGYLGKPFHEPKDGD